LRLSFQNEQIGLVTRHEKSGEIRKIDTISFAERVNQNIPKFQERMILCDEAAPLLGYPIHAVYRIAANIVKASEAVNNFVADLKSRRLVRAESSFCTLTVLSSRTKATDKGYDGQASFRYVFGDYDADYYG
jgi:Zn-dependent oligopeptidase